MQRSITYLLSRSAGTNHVGGQAWKAKTNATSPLARIDF